MRAEDVKMTITWFATAFPKGKALGEPELITWKNFTQVLFYRREGEKDGLAFATASFKPIPGSRLVRRTSKELFTRTAIALDIETNKQSGEIPVAPSEVASRIRTEGLACVIYSSHNHNSETNRRYRIVFALSEEIGVNIRAAIIIAERFGLQGVLDKSKTNAESIFYLPSCPEDHLHLHFLEVVDGDAIDAGWLVHRNETSLPILIDKSSNSRPGIIQQIVTSRRGTNFSSRKVSDESIITKIRSHLDLETILIGHGYLKSGQRFKHPKSTSGNFGSNIKCFGGIERFYSCNATDPLHFANLPEWCGKVRAVDAFDVVAILDFGGDRNKAISNLSRHLNLDKADDKKTLARLLFKLIREQAPQTKIEDIVLTQGKLLGFSESDICQIAKWVNEKAIKESV
jgi:hypothetical protein